ncbi:MAG TPA: FAD-dependent oxidoreductase [Thermoanaerobaculia bacterium]|nr:FAD-dependent oxidoreductase [Thermoanaerobaculia bacterium]
MIRSALVVGAGIVGAACAEALAAAGVAVRVLERGRPGGGATGAAMGHVLVLDDSEAQLALSRLSRDLWDARREELPRTVERDECGTIWVAADPEELETVRAKHAWLAERSVASEILDPHALSRHEPNLRPGLAGGLRIAADSVVYPPGAVRWLLERAAARGARIDEGVPIRYAGEGEVTLEDGSTIEADAVVVAAGLDTPKLVDVTGLVVRPKKGHLAITDRVPGFVRHQLVELGYLKSAHGAERTSVAFNAQPRATGQVLLGSSRQLDDDDPRVEPEVLSRMVRRGIEYLPGLAEIPVLRAWVGFRPATEDNLPVIGPVPGRPRLWIATGHEGVGIATSLATARLLVDQIRGVEPPIDSAPYLPARLARSAAHA